MKQSLTAFDGLNLIYHVDGDVDVKPVVLLHGLGADHRMWQPQLESFPAAGWRVIAPDMRGHGASDMPQTFSLADCARDIADILAANDIEKASVVGVSMGGLIAQQMACDFPDKVEKLIIVDSFSGVRGTSGKINAGMASFLLKVLPGRVQSKLLTATYSRMGHPEVAFYFEEQMGKVNGRSLREMRAVVNQFDILDRLPSVTAPTLVLVGDGFGKSAIEMARETGTAIPNAQFEILPGGGDPSNLLVPDKFDAAVLPFLAEDGVAT